MLPSKHQYFDDEARLARTAAGARLYPEIPSGARVVSVGCGGGWAGEAAGASRFAGLDIDPDAGEFRRLHTPNCEFHLGNGESLPFANNEFTFYVARVSLMYMDLRKAFSEAYRVLEGGGTFWCTLHDFNHVWSHWKQSVKSLRLKDIAYRSYVLGNGAIYHLVGRTIRFPLKKSRVESFQTAGSVRRGLTQAGFSDIAFPKTVPGHFLVTARKPQLPGRIGHP